MWSTIGAVSISSSTPGKAAFTKVPCSTVEPLADQHAIFIRQISAPRAAFPSVVAIRFHTAPGIVSHQRRANHHRPLEGTHLGGDPYESPCATVVRWMVILLLSC